MVLLFLIAIVVVVGIGVVAGLTCAAILRRSRFDLSLGKKAALMGGMASAMASLLVAHRPVWEGVAILVAIGCFAGFLAVATALQGGN